MIARGKSTSIWTDIRMFWVSPGKAALKNAEEKSSNLDPEDSVPLAEQAASQETGS